MCLVEKQEEKGGRMERVNSHEIIHFTDGNFRSADNVWASKFMVGLVDFYERFEHKSVEGCDYSYIIVYVQVWMSHYSCSLKDKLFFVSVDVCSQLLIVAIL